MARAWIPESVLKALPRLSGSAVKLAVILCKYADKNGHCYPSEVQLMAGMGTQRWQTFRDAREELKTQCGLSWEASQGRRRIQYHLPPITPTLTVEDTKPVTPTESVYTQTVYSTESVPVTPTQSVECDSTESVEVHTLNYPLNSPLTAQRAPAHDPAADEGNGFTSNGHHSNPCETASLKMLVDTFISAANFCGDPRQVYDAFRRALAFHSEAKLQAAITSNAVPGAKPWTITDALTPPPPKPQRPRPEGRKWVDR